MKDQFAVEWIDRRREPQCQPDPAYPTGKDVMAVYPGEDQFGTCKIELPYPAKRCGVYAVRCARCGMSIGVTTAGRPDDPRSVTVACLEPLQ